MATQQTKQPYLSVIIPAYNESKRLPTTLIDIDKHLSQASFDYEIIVVDNNSKDATREIVTRFTSFIKNLYCIECKKQGKGAAVQKGMLESHGKIRLFMDADNSTAINHFFLMEHYFKEGFDVVIGSRDIEGAKLVPPQPWIKRVLGDMGNLFIQIMLLPGMKDTQCGFKAFSEKAALSIFPHITILGWGFDVEVLTLARQLDFKTKEIPVTWVNDIRSLVTPMAYVKTLLDVIVIKWRLVRKQYALHRKF